MSSQDDFNAGLGGAAAGPNSDAIAHQAGRTVRENIEMNAQANQQPKTKYSLVPDQKIEVSGAGMGFMIFAPLFYIFYPVGGAVNLAVSFAAMGAVELITKVKGFIWLAGFGSAIVMIVPALMLESKVSRFAPYRWVRHAVRVVLMGVIIFNAVNYGAPKTGGIYTPEYQIPYAAIFWALVTAVAAHYITMTLDLMLSMRPVPKVKMKKVAQPQTAQETWTEGTPEKSKPISNKWILWGVLYMLVLIMFSKHINPVYGILAAVVFVVYKVKRGKKNNQS